MNVAVHSQGLHVLAVQALNWAEGVINHGKVQAGMPHNLAACFKLAFLHVQSLLSVGMSDTESCDCPCPHSCALPFTTWPCHQQLSSQHASPATPGSG